MQFLKRPHVIIVGAGITGLALGYELKKKGVTFAILEASNGPGGKIRTQTGEALMEHGPDSFFTRKPYAIDLCGELGLHGEMIKPRASKHPFHIYKRGRLIPLPAGVMTGIPTQIAPLIATPLFSWASKLRIACDLLISQKPKTQDESVASFIGRRLGQEALAYLADPVMCGIYNADSAHLSMRAVFPQLLELEKKHQSLARPQFLSFRGGMSTLVNALVEKLGDHLHTGAPVKTIHQTKEGIWEIEAGQLWQAQHVVVTTPAKQASGLLPESLGQAKIILEQFRTTSSGSAYLAYPREALTMAIEGSGILIPRREQRNINAITFVSEKFAGRALPNQLLLRVFFGGPHNSFMMRQPESKIVPIIKKELSEILGLTAQPLWTQVFKNIDASPQYDVGHLDKVAALKRQLPPGLHLTGSPYSAGGIPDCIRMAKETALLVADAKTTLDERRDEVGSGYQQ